MMAGAAAARQLPLNNPSHLDSLHSSPVATHACTLHLSTLPVPALLTKGNHIDLSWDLTAGGGVAVCDDGGPPGVACPREPVDEHSPCYSPARAVLQLPRACPHVLPSLARAAALSPRWLRLLRRRRQRCSHLLRSKRPQGPPPARWMRRSAGQRCALLPPPQPPPAAHPHPQVLSQHPTHAYTRICPPIHSHPTVPAARRALRL